MTRTLLGMFLLLLALSARAQDFVIQSFHSDITVNRDASIRIKETIRVVFSQPKRGIFRTVPYRYKVLSGPDRFAQISNLTATFDNGLDPGRSLSDDGYSKTLRLGYATKFLEVGKPYTYVVTYKVDRAFNWFDQDKTWQPWAELYWNIS